MEKKITLFHGSEKVIEHPVFGEGKKQKKGNRTRGKFYDGSHFPHGKSGRRQPLRSAFRRGNFQFFKRTRGG